MTIWQNCCFGQFKNRSFANCSAFVSFASVSLMRENLKGLRENLKHKFRSIVESGCVRVVNDVQFDFDVVDIVENPLISEMDLDQGNLLKDIDKKTSRREGIEPIKRVFTYVPFSVKHFL